MKNKYKILIGLLLLLFVGAITYFDAGLYKEPVMIVKSVKQVDSISIDDDGNRQVTQKISGVGGSRTRVQA